MFIPRFIRHPVIRRKVGFSELDLNRYSIQIARKQSEYEEAFRLVHVGYVFQGIERLGPLDLRITEQHVLPEATVMIAQEEGRTIGTMTLTEDSPAGLCLDADYPDEMKKLRDTGAVLAEIGSLAIVRCCWHSGAVPLLALATVRHAMRHTKMTHLVIGVNPATADYYRAIWGFDVFGEAKGHSKLAAPVIALCVTRAKMMRHCYKYFSQPMRQGPSLYEYLFEDPRWPWEDDMPRHLSPQEQARWKMPREVFRDLFVTGSNRVSSLSPATRTHLRCKRTDATVQAKTSDSIPEKAASAPSQHH